MKPGTIVDVAPGLRISFAEDGVFLHAESNGKHGAINLEELGTPAICREAFLAWAHETGSRLSGKTLEQEWLDSGYYVRFSETEPRAYEVCRIVKRKFMDGERDEIGSVEARLPTVQEVSKWIREHPTKPKCEICGDRARIGNDIPCPECNPEGK